MATSAVHNISARMNNEQKAQLDFVVDHMKGRTMIKPSQADVIRYAIEKLYLELKAETESVPEVKTVKKGK